MSNDGWNSADIDQAKADLIAAGWVPKSPTIWKSPDGRGHLGPANAWKTMKREQNDARHGIHAPACPVVRSREPLACTCGASRRFAPPTPEHSESVRVEHARKQGAADGFQQGWHAALSRIRQGDKVTDMMPLVPNPAVALIEQLSNQLHAVEWVRQASGNRYACPQCHGITERDGGNGHADDCQAEQVRREAEDFIHEHAVATAPESAEKEKP